MYICHQGSNGCGRNELLAAKDRIVAFVADLNELLPPRNKRNKEGSNCCPIKTNFWPKTVESAEGLFGVVPSAPVPEDTWASGPALPRPLAPSLVPAASSFVIGVAGLSVDV